MVHIITPDFLVKQDFQDSEITQYRVEFEEMVYYYIPLIHCNPHSLHLSSTSWGAGPASPTLRDNRVKPLSPSYQVGI